MLKRFLLTSLLLFAFTTPAYAKSSKAPAEAHKEAKQKPVAKQHFKGSIKGFDAAPYTVSGKKGDILEFHLKSKNPKANVNVFAPGYTPGENADPLFNGSQGGPDGRIVLPADGEYTLQVLQTAPDGGSDGVTTFKLDAIVYSMAAKKKPHFQKISGSDKVPFYKAPNNKKKGKGEASPGDIVLTKRCVKKKDESWCLVSESNGQSGWIDGTLVEEL